MLVAKRVRVAYPGHDFVSEPLSMAMAPGERVALTGDNGSGKTLLALTIAGLLEPVEGEITLDGNVVSDPAARKQIGLLFQDPDAQFLTGTVRGELSFPLENLGVERERIEERVDDLLEELELRAVADRSLHALSGGQKARVALGAALAPDPRLLIVDEPTVYLDTDSRRRLAEVLERFRRRGRGLLWVTQYAEEWAGADRGYRFADGRLEERETRRPLPAVSPSIPPTALATSGPPGAVLLRARNLSFRYPEEKEAGATVLPERFRLEEVDLELRAGECVLVRGASGAGKSTLLLLLAGVLEPDAGTIELPRGTPEDGRLPMGVLLQSPEDQLVSPTVLEDVLLGAEVSCDASDAKSRAAARSRAAEEALRKTGLEPGAYGEKPPSLLSHGQRRRVSWAGVAVLNTRIWLLDEPTSGLDERGLRDFAEWIDGFLAEAGAVFLVSQDPRLDGWPGRRLRLEGGRIRPSETPPKARCNPPWETPKT